MKKYLYLIIGFCIGSILQGLLEYRDKSFIKYHSNKKFLEKIKKKFGMKAVSNIKEINKIKLKRKILEEPTK